MPSDRPPFSAPPPRRMGSGVGFDELYPTAQTYLDGLPEGLASLPGCQVKGSVVRELMLKRGVADLRDSLPAALQSYFDVPPDVTAWLPELHLQVLLLATFDRSFSTSPNGETAFLQWLRESNRALFKHPLYKILFSVISPEHFFNRADRRWSTFRRGSSLEKMLVEPGQARLRIHHPRGLYSELLAKARATAFRVAAECAGAHSLETTIENRTPVELDILLRWH